MLILVYKERIRPVNHICTDNIMSKLYKKVGMLCNMLVYQLSLFMTHLCILHHQILLISEELRQCITLDFVLSIYGIRKYDESLKIFLSQSGLICKTAFVYKLFLCIRGWLLKEPLYLYNKISLRADVHHITIRNRGLICPLHLSAMFERSFSFYLYKYYNSLPRNLNAP